ncbi:MAG: hypothetical protein Fues2KO_16990 [Fuerstiella sp.]
MSHTRNKLNRLLPHMDESMGQRSTTTASATTEAQSPQFSPVPSARDIGREPDQRFGRLRLDCVQPDPDQPRQQFDDNELQQLAASLKRDGQLQPIRVRWDATLEKWIIVAGERRYRAALLANLPTIDCCFEERSLEDTVKLEQQLIENLQRSDLNILEEARAYQQLMTMTERNGRELARSLNISSTRVSRALALLKLPYDIQQQIQQSDIPATTAYELTKINNPRQQRTLAQRAAAGQLPQRDVANILKQQKRHRRRQSTGLKLTFLAENGIRIQVQSPRHQNYHEVLDALQQTLEDVQLRIDNNILL